MQKQINLPEAFEVGFLEINKQRQQAGQRPLTKKRVLEVILSNVFPNGDPQAGESQLVKKLLEE